MKSRHSSALGWAGFAAMGLAMAAAPVVHAASFVRNPSFESNYNEAFPHYSGIDEWTGGSGVNEASGPFHNGGTPIPDQARAAFLQGSAQLSQEITGLTPGKRYVIQFNYDARGCCGGTIDLITRFNDADIDRVSNVKPATGGKPYFTRTVAFTPDVDTGKLTFATAASGDATVNLDAVSVVQRDAGNVPVLNPSFEASGLPPDTGVVSPAGLGGWTGVGEYGVNASGLGSFADNGTAPDQDLVAFIHGVGALSQTLAGLVVGQTYQLSFGYNAKLGNRPHLRVSVDGAAVHDEDVTPVGGSAAYRSKTLSFKAVSNAATLAFAQTVDGDQTLLLDDIRVVGQLEEKFPPIVFSPAKAELSPGQAVAVTLALDSAIPRARASVVQVRSSNAGIMTLVNADTNGIVSLSFPKGGNNVLSFEVRAVARGVARVEVVTADGLDVANDVGVNVTTSYVKNPSFESSPAPSGIGAGPILSWDGGLGLNKAGMPFLDNGLSPDRDQVAVLQGSRTFSQTVSGLSAGRNHWLQFRYNVRNCCGDTRNMDLTVRLGGKEIASIKSIAAVGDQNAFHFQNVSFVPEVSEGLLEFVSKATGDATLLLDAVSIVQRDASHVVIQNPSFEATGSPVGVGYLQPGRVAGWEITGGYGVNITGVGPFTDNGATSDQDTVLFLQGPATLSQNITGLTAGAKYTLIYSMNARNCCGGGFTKYNVSFADEPLLEEEVTPVGARNPFEQRYLVFTAAGSEGVLRFQTTPEGDHTFLIDDIQIAPGVVEQRFSLALSRDVDGNLRVAWPAAAVGHALQSTAALPGGWQNVPDAPTQEGVLNVVTISTASGTRFYRLRK